MRPLIRPDLPLQIIGRFTAASLLMSAFGHFCSFCERPLPDESWVWNARTGRCLEDHSCDISDWESLYLLDRNCHAAQQRACEFDPRRLLLPTSVNSFTPLRRKSPLRYSMQSLCRVFVDDQAQVIDREYVSRVVVSGYTDTARATIRYFALNTPYYQWEKRELIIPMQDYLSLEDRRMDQRTQAWINAEEVALRILNAYQFSLGRTVTEQFRLLAGSTGYWSSSATAASKVLHSLHTLRQIFFEAPEPARTGLIIEGLEPNEVLAFRGCGPHHTFPGTKDVFF